MMSREQFERLADAVLAVDPSLAGTGWHRVGNDWYNSYRESTLSTMDAADRANFLNTWTWYLVEECGLSPKSDGSTWTWHENGTVLVGASSREQGIGRALCTKLELDWARFS